MGETNEILLLIKARLGVPCFQGHADESLLQTWPYGLHGDTLSHFQGSLLAFLVQIDARVLMTKISSGIPSLSFSLQILRISLRPKNVCCHGGHACQRHSRFEKVFLPDGSADPWLLGVQSSRWYALLCLHVRSLKITSAASCVEKFEDAHHCPNSTFYQKVVSKPATVALRTYGKEKKHHIRYSPSKPHSSKITHSAMWALDGTVTPGSPFLSCETCSGR